MSDAEFAPLLIFILILGFIVAFASVKICAQYQRAVVFFLGRYARTSGPGLFLLLPFLEWRSTVDIRTSATSVEEQETITKDNVPMKINAVIWRRVVDPQRSLIEVANVGDSVTQAAVTALRATIGQHTLDEVLKDQDSIAAELQIKLDAVTEPWGVKVEQVQMKNIEIPATMQRAMAQEAEALREKRARQIKAEAELEAAKVLKLAADIIATAPASLELRRMQMLTEVGAEQNTMTIVMLPSEFVDLARAVTQKSRAE
jgi:regulator of protease activity HflC (stomatin/prohibitin superfamily)